jgi:hypothetical protein
MLGAVVARLFSGRSRYPLEQAMAMVGDTVILHWHCLALTLK